MVSLAGQARKARAWPLSVALLALPCPARAQVATSANVAVDASAAGSPLERVWPFYGYDEINYTTSPEGKALLAELVNAHTAPVHVRNHFLFNNGDGTPSLKWGSTNVYSEDATGAAVYSWPLTDEIMDTITNAGAYPFVELGFMPEALSSHPVPYLNSSTTMFDSGCSYPPADYEKWASLIRTWATHANERYPNVEAAWLWELWNEPDIAYWKGTVDDYAKLYDHTEAALHEVLPGAALGGPAVAGVANGFLKQFLEHCATGTNAVTGELGTRLDLVTFHAKGGVSLENDHVQMNLGGQLRLHRLGFKIVAAFPQFSQTPIYITEADPDGCAACPASTVPSNQYRNSTAYGAYELAMMKRTLELEAQVGIKLGGVLSWAFTFPNTPYFAGYRSLSSNGIHLPVLSAFQLLGRLAGARVPLTSTGARSLNDVVEQGVRDQPDIDGMATLDGGAVQVLLWNYHDDLVGSPPSPVHLTVQLPTDFGTHARTSHLRVDEQHGNAYTVWLEQGSPTNPTKAQLAALQKAMVPSPLRSDETVAVQADGSVAFDFELPRFGVSLLTLLPASAPKGGDDSTTRAAPGGCACRANGHREPSRPLALSALLLAAFMGRRGVRIFTQRSACRGQKLRLFQPQLGQPVVTGNAQHTTTVNEAAAHADGRGFRKVGGWTGYFGDVEAEEGGLNQYFVVEHEVIGVFSQRQALQHPARKGAVARVVLGQLLPDQQVLDRGQGAVGDVLVQRHTTGQRTTAQNARAQRHVVQAAGDAVCQRGHQPRRVLVVRVNHDHDVGAATQGCGVASLLVCSIATIASVNDGIQPEPKRQLGCSIGRPVIDQNDLIDALWHLCDRPLQRGRGVVGGHDEHQLVAVDHARHCSTARNKQRAPLRPTTRLARAPA